MIECVHESTPTVWRMRFQSIKVCVKCGMFWHVLGKKERHIEIGYPNVHKYFKAYIYPLYKKTQ